MKTAIYAKPFLKWAGGKKQLLPEINKHLPEELIEGKIDTYIEPFLGGGSVLFDLLKQYRFKEVIVNDVNVDLIQTYSVVRDNVEELISILELMEHEYITQEKTERDIYYYIKRDSYNKLKVESLEDIPTSRYDSILLAAHFIFLNKTCFNGLYRVNSHGLFNVPTGVYKNPLISNSENLRAASRALQNVTFISGSYIDMDLDIDFERSFMYVDPPYRELPNTKNFTSYSNSEFNEQTQIELANWLTRYSNSGIKILSSNSDPSNTSETDTFFIDNYVKHGFDLHQVKAYRNINSKGNGRGQITELLIKNY